MKIFRATIVTLTNASDEGVEFEAHVYVNRGWINTNSQWVMYKTRKAAKKRAERVATELGISLKWEEG
ncbi:hypothetical protein LCGC14_1037320 [marine sediment metagenome]|uniref:Uncharacterized protein n=1 Tax=marine sediment metagenome TaxID=412755 RepID=A0A0F9QB41_9ZZZZ